MDVAFVLVDHMVACHKRAENFSDGINLCLGLKVTCPLGCVPWSVVSEAQAPENAVHCRRANLGPIPDCNMDAQASCSPDGKRVPKLGGRLDDVLVDGGLDGRRNLGRPAVARSIVEAVDAVAFIALDPLPDCVFTGIEHARNLRDAVVPVREKHHMCPLRYPPYGSAPQSLRVSDLVIVELSYESLLSYASLDA